MLFRSERLQDPWFERSEPEELLYDEIEELWAAISRDDDWGPFERKLERIEKARRAWSLADA